MTRVILVDDDPLVRTMLTNCLDAAPGLVVRGSYGSGTDAVAAVPVDQPHVALVDIVMPDPDGPETTRLLQAARDTAAGIVHRAEERAEQIVARSEDDARRLRDEGVADAAHERRVAADEARKLISDAAEQRRTVLGELARRRDLASNQLHELIRGRDVLVQALSNVAVSSNDLVTRLDSISVTPGDFVNLDPARSDADPGVDRGSVVRVDFAPPEPGTARAVRQAASSEPLASSGAVAPSAAGADDDGGPVLFTLDG